MAENHESPVRITEASIKNWKNFTRAEAKFEQRVFLVGPNAAGKSNFLDLFRFLRDLVSVGGGFQESVRRRGDDGAREYWRRQTPEARLRALEFSRQVFYGYDPDTTRLQRVVEAVELGSS